MEIHAGGQVEENMPPLRLGISGGSGGRGSGRKWAPTIAVNGE